MNLRHPKVIRLGRWGALATTLLAVAAGAFLSSTFLQAGDLVNGGIASAMTVACAVCGGLLTYCLFVFVSPTTEAAANPGIAEPAQSPVADPAPKVTANPDELTAAPALDIAGSTAPPETSDDAIPVFSTSSTAPVLATDSDDFDEALLVVPPPIAAPYDSDVPVAETVAEATTSIWDDEFDSSMDLPVTGHHAPDESSATAEQSDDVDGPAPVVQSQTAAVASALTPTAEMDAVSAAEPSATKPEAPVAPSVTAAPPAVQAFPEIFKSSPVARTPVPPPAPAAEAPPAPAPQPVSVPAAAPAVAIVSRPAPAPAAASAPRPASVPAAKAPAVKAPPAKADAPAVEPSIDELLPTAADLPAMATTLTPTKPGGSALPTEIPDFFLRMPTGRAVPAPRPAMPIAPVAPRQVAPPTPVQPAAPAAVRIIDSSTVTEAEDDLVTMTSIPDDWPS